MQRYLASWNALAARQFLIDGFSLPGNRVPAESVGRFDATLAAHPPGVLEVAEDCVDAPADRVWVVVN